MFSSEKLIERLRSVPHFKNFQEREIRDIVLSGRILRIPKGETIFHEGEDCAGLFVLLQGKVNLMKTGIQGQETIIMVIKPVIMFNEVSILDGGPNPVSAMPVHDCLMWHISYQSYQMLMSRYPLMGTALLRVLAKRNRALLERIEDLSSRPVLARSAKTLLDLSQHGENPINRRHHPNNEIAALVSTVPEAFSRSLTNLRQMGIIEVTRSQISVSDVASLTKIAQIEPLVLSSSKKIPL